MKGVDDRFFLYSQKIKEVLIMKEEFIKGQLVMEEAKAHVTKLCFDSQSMVHSFKTESLETIREIRESTARVESLTDDHTARLTFCEEEIKSINKRLT